MSVRFVAAAVNPPVKLALVPETASLKAAVPADSAPVVDKLPACTAPLVSNDGTDNSVAKLKLSNAAVGALKYPAVIPPVK